jgi:sodium-dependent dicarboxylate transporter 2/3/5
MRTRAKLIGLVVGPIVAVLLYAWLPEQYLNEQGDWVSLSSAARAAASVGLWMAVWWITEAISVYATALLPLAVFPLIGAASMKATAASYGHELIYLFLGGFILAMALESCGLHRRFAIRVLGLVGTRPTHIVGAFMGLSAFISMWVTNTATTIMLLPVALSIIRMVSGPEPTDAAPVTARSATDDASRPERNLSVCLLLGVAYAASIGGVGTIIGTAPNAFLVSFIQNQTGREISFVRWMSIGVPFVLVFLPLAWWLLCRRIYPVATRRIPGADKLLAELNNQLGKMKRAEKLTLAIFIMTAAAWIFRPLLNAVHFGGVAPFAGLTDPGIAVIAALLLFVTPVDISAGKFLIDWQTAVKLPWGLLILFGGGLSLAAALDHTGFSEFLGNLALILAQLPTWVIVMFITGMMIFLTEMTSNTATTATLIPILYAVAVGLGVDPYLLIIPAGIAASCAFMLPVATPPNAIVFGSGLVTIPQMSRAGIRLNVVGIVVLTVLTYAWIIPVLGITG